MRQVILNIDENRYMVFLQFLQTLQYVQVVRAQGTLPNAQRPKIRYDFSDLTGKLEWKGDAIAEQRRLRNEW